MKYGPLFDAAADLPRKLGSEFARSTPAYARGSKTSRDAAEAATGPRLTQLQLDYLEHNRRRGGLTDHKAAALLNRPLSSINSTRNRLVKLGLVKATDRQELSPFGCWATVWVTWEMP